MLARACKRAGDRQASIAIHAAFGTQILLGIATVLTGVSLWLAVLHQLVGALLVAATAWGAHSAGGARTRREDRRAELIWCPFADEDERRGSGRQLLDEGLVACANLRPADALALRTGTANAAKRAKCGALFKTEAGLLARASRADRGAPFLWEAPAIVGWEAVGAARPRASGSRRWRDGCHEAAADPAPRNRTAGDRCLRRLVVTGAPARAAVQLSPRRRQCCSRAG